MAAPSPTARGTPGGLKLEDGFASMITFSSNATVKLFEKSVTPPPVDGGEAIDHTTHHNTAWRTKSARTLKDMGPSAMVCCYDPKVYDQIIALVNVEQAITVTFWDGSTLAYYGFLQKFEPAAMVEGTAPEATCTIVATNYDPTNHVEAAPVMTEVSGT